MLVDVRPTGRLRGPQRLDLAGVMGPLVGVLGDDAVDLSGVRLVCDWVQYRNNFREVVDARPILDASQRPGAGVEIAVDLRRCADADLEIAARQALTALADPVGARRLHLEPFTPGSGSVIWNFNALYWQSLALWEEATGRQYEQALPGGKTDARNVDAARELIRELFEIWDSLDERHALPETLSIVELGVGNGSQAKVWLDEFRRLDREHGKGYYRRLHYVMGDYSPHVLELARGTVADHAEHVSSVVLDATKPMTALRFLRHQAFLVYLSNVYDNLPTDEIARIGGRNYRVEVRAYLPASAAQAIAARIGADVAEIPGLVRKLLRLGPEVLSDAAPHHFPDPTTAVLFWQECWRALRLEERYAPLEGLDLYTVAPGVTGEALWPLLAAGGDLRTHVSNGAVASFVDSLPLLHPHGQLHCHDLFVTDRARYETAFCGPGKYDGSVVNWVNGLLLRHLGARRGYEVDYRAFQHRTGANVTTLTARARD